MERLSKNAIAILNELHTERLDYNSEYVPLMNALNELQYLEDAEEQGRLVVLDEPRKPIIWGDETHDSVHCPNCGEDLMGIPYGNQIVVNCPFCGEYIDATKTVTREAAESKLKEMERK